MKCKCGEKTTGWTTVKCCNICGLPIPEEVWDIPKADEAKSEVRVEAPVKPEIANIDKIIEYAFNKGEMWGVTYGGWFAPSEKQQAERLEEAINDTKEEFGL